MNELFIFKLLCLTSINSDSSRVAQSPWWLGFGLMIHGLITRRRIFFCSVEQPYWLWATQPPVQLVPGVLSPGVVIWGYLLLGSYATSMASVGDQIPLFW